MYDSKYLSDLDKLTVSVVMDFLVWAHGKIDIETQKSWSALLANPVLPLLYLEAPSLSVEIRQENTLMVNMLRGESNYVWRHIDETPTDVARQLAEQIAESYWYDIDPDGQADIMETYARNGDTGFGGLADQDYDWISEQWQKRFNGKFRRSRKTHSHGVDIASKYNIDKIARYRWQELVEEAIAVHENEEEEE